MKKRLVVLSVLAAALLLFTSCLDSDGVLSAKKYLTMPAEIANIPAGSTLAINVRPSSGILPPPADINEPFSNDWVKEPEFNEWFSINGGATEGCLDEYAFVRGGADDAFIKEQAEAVFEYYLTTQKGVYFQPNDDDQKALFATAPADFNYETWPYEPVLVAGGETLAPTFVMADDPATADYTLDVYYSFQGDVKKVTEFDNPDGLFKDYWDENKRYVKQAGDVYLYYRVFTNYKLINNATGDVVCDALTQQGDANIKKNTNPSISGNVFLGNTDDPAALLNPYDFQDKAVDLVLESIQKVIPCLRVMWFCNADDMTIIYPETAAE